MNRKEMNHNGHYEFTLCPRARRRSPDLAECPTAGLQVAQALLLGLETYGRKCAGSGDPRTALINGVRKPYFNNDVHDMISDGDSPMAGKDEGSSRTGVFHVETLAGSDRILQELGYWPSFHDGILESLYLDPSLSGTGTDIRLRLRVHRILDEVDEQGFYKLIDHLRLTFLFHNAVLQSLSMNMFPDILMDFKLQNFEPDRGNDSTVEVRLVGTGVIDFVCDQAEVIDICRITDSD